MKNGAKNNLISPFSSESNANMLWDPQIILETSPKHKMHFYKTRGMGVKFTP